MCVCVLTISHSLELRCAPLLAAYDVLYTSCRNNAVIKQPASFRRLFDHLRVP